MRLVRIVFFAILALGVWLAMATLVRAAHNPIVDVGTEVWLASWCNELDDARELVEVIKQKDNDVAVTYFLSEDNTCYHIAAPRAIGLPQLPPLRVIVLEIVEEIDMGVDNWVAVIALVETAQGKMLYTFHHYQSTDA
jgi:hypothetical protein